MKQQKAELFTQKDKEEKAKPYTDAELLIYDKEDDLDRILATMEQHLKKEQKKE